MCMQVGLNRPCMHANTVTCGGPLKLRVDIYIQQLTIQQFISHHIYKICCMHARMECVVYMTNRSIFAFKIHSNQPPPARKITSQPLKQLPFPEINVFPPCLQVLLVYSYRVIQSSTQIHYSMNTHNSSPPFTSHNNYTCLACGSN